MVDFLVVSTRAGKRGVVEIYPKFIIKNSNDLMIRGGDFYAVWLEDQSRWSTDEQDVLQLIDRELDIYAAENKDKIDAKVKVMHMWDAESGMIDTWHKYCQKQMRDSFHMLDEELIFSNTKVKKRDYSSKRLPYPLEPGECPAYERLMSVLYSPEERKKIEWAIGSIVTGDSKKVQKFLVLYGAAGTGKSTVLNIIQQLFEGYYSVFDAKALGSSSNAFALEAFKSNPLVAIQHDGDLSRIEDNTRLNSLVSHELMTVNEKFKSTYSNRFKAFLFMGTNKPVKITDGRSGLIRRLIDVSPTGDKLDTKEYKTTVKQIAFELGAIACHCRDVYLEDPGFYDDYIPISMLGASNDFYNFMLDSYFVFEKDNSTTLKAAWEMYKVYCEDAKIQYAFTQRVFKEELKNYFREYKDRYVLEDGTRVRSFYEDFRRDKFEENQHHDKKIKKLNIEYNKIKFNKKRSIFDDFCADCPAQYATEDEIPKSKWSNVKTKLSDIDTSKIHYAKVLENHIVIDFDIPDETGEKSFERNLEEASKWPPTYAELSKSGKGIHLHYIYTGDPTMLSRLYSDHVEIKVFTGKSSLRRKLTKCNDLPIATISSGLPLKGEKKMVNFEGIKSEKGLRRHIRKNLNKEFHPNTKPSIDLIKKTLDDAYASGMSYDVSDMRSAVLTFAMTSTNQADICVKTVNKMHFKSDDISDPVDNSEMPIVFYDIEVFPNLFLVNWKKQGEDEVHRMINPKPEEIEELIKYRLIGFNCRRYDNHILYARLMHYTVEQLYNLSQKIVNGSRNALFGEAYNISYADVYDFAAKKQSLKKWEIELDIHHQELGMPWDQPVPRSLWDKVAEYCDNDVIATEAVFNHLQADFTAREILADLCGMAVNDTTNSLSTRIIFGTNRKPQDQFNYRNMGDISKIVQKKLPVKDVDPEYTVFDAEGRPIFPGYVYDGGKSTYRGEEVGEGGYVYAEEGMYGNVALLDIASMHPSSVIAEDLFGSEYTQRFKELKDARIAIKHEDWATAEQMLDGKLAKYIQKCKDGELSSKNMASALKIVINSVYGLTAASFDNPFHDPRNVDNIVAKRGALFMVNLKHEVQKRGYIVAHIKTDSIKIPDADQAIIDFVMEYGKLYGYIFEHEDTYEKMCLVNNAVYIAKHKDGSWTATGAQFAVPYVFKTLFSKKPIEFSDLCETKSVTSSIYLDFNEELPDVSKAEKELTLARKLEVEKAHLSVNTPEYDQLQKDIDILEREVAEGHNYHFVGKVGLFTPIKPGCGGALLMRETVNKTNGIKGYANVTGAKGYRWMESEMVKNLHKEDDIDKSYYQAQVDDAVEAISKYGDFEWFVSDDPYESPPFNGGRIQP